MPSAPPLPLCLCFIVLCLQFDWLLSVDIESILYVALVSLISLLFYHTNYFHNIRHITLVIFITILYTYCASLPGPPVDCCQSDLDGQRRDCHQPLRPPVLTRVSKQVRARSLRRALPVCWSSGVTVRGCVTKPSSPVPLDWRRFRTLSQVADCRPQYCWHSILY